ncbi:MAG: hypothetical protein KGJ94_03975, partial [Xanthomonadaceae bacterium]|nr:hypothetical protein [Xanthomonadaceae bacterium]
MSADANQARTGSTADALFTEVYDRLKAMASRRLATGYRGGTLDTTELVHELYLRVGDRPELRFEEPAQFFAYAARAMRHLLVNRARDRLRLRAGGQWKRVTLDDRDTQLAIETAEQAHESGVAVPAPHRDRARRTRVRFAADQHHRCRRVERRHRQAGDPRHLRYLPRRTQHRQSLGGSAAQHRHFRCQPPHPGHAAVHAHQYPDRTGRADHRPRPGDADRQVGRHRQVQGADPAR